MSRRSENAIENIYEDMGVRAHHRPFPAVFETGALGPVHKVRLTDRMRRRTGCRSGRVNEQGEERMRK
ncbi:hypothetical protein ALC53_01537 [Atta colombica]|uniref:Uncharacterized protein n=1 Tax=Atta colombica TaxID=520822 RepID=A0A195BTR9_9HYME|nr:hypothetical protein ALC53_01537 [Atta colombica]